MSYELDKLVATYNEHNCIVVGVDFDDTVFPFTNSMFVEDRCKIVRDLLISIRSNITLCLYTVADEQTLKYKVEIMNQYGLSPDYINDSPVSPWEDSKKLFFNILLDDKAGLNETIETLTKFKDRIE